MPPGVLSNEQSSNNMVFSTTSAGDGAILAVMDMGGSGATGSRRLAPSQRDTALEALSRIQAKKVNRNGTTAEKNVYLRRETESK